LKKSLKEKRKMANLGQTFNADDLGGSANKYDPLPAGWYSAVVHSAEVKDTNAGTGQYIKLRYDITGPTQEGRVVWSNLNHRNPNADAQRIALENLGEFMRAIGLANIEDSDQLVRGPDGSPRSLDIKVKVTKPSKGADGTEYAAGNDVEGWKASKGSSMPKPAAPSAPAEKSQEAQDDSASSPPWAKK
tara:strand:- start:427 stop:993 length:567 start_codon:yes stop_codon:yes gene_type:complete